MPPDKWEVGEEFHRSTGLKSRAPKTAISLNYANAYILSNIHRNGYHAVLSLSRNPSFLS